MGVSMSDGFLFAQDSNEFFFFMGTGKYRLELNPKTELEPHGGGSH